MPQINKIRVVNVYYDGGKRLIPDELYDLHAGSGGSLNTLFNLTNGGGKSVLVQFLMQPIRPNARASGRRIGDFFTRATDHCYVLLEWNKDNSEEKLLTGISMRAVNSAVTDDTGRGRSINYYTFYTEYTGHSKYSIEELELSRRENGRFVPAEFDYVRKLRAGSQGALQVYSSDENTRWADKLREYGIYQEEWTNVIQKLNVQEGGLMKFFAEIRSSDRLISDFFLPAIDDKISGETEARDRSQDTSLATMLIRYAGKVAEKADKIRQSKSNEKLLGSLEEVSARCGSMKELDDACRENQGKGFAFTQALKGREDQAAAEADELRGNAEALAREERHIAFEQASDAYYKAKAESDEAEAKRLKAEHSFQERKDAYEQAGLDLKRMQCCGYAQTIREDEGEIAGSRARIMTIESGSENASRLRDLRYSIQTKASEELTGRKAAADALGRELYEDMKRREETEQRSKALSAEGGKLQEQHQSGQAALAEYKKGTDQTAEKAGYAGGRMLSGFYAEDEADAYEGKLAKEQERIAGRIAGLEEAEQKAEESLQRIPVRISETRRDAADYEKEIRDISTRKEAYKAEYTFMKKTAEEYSMGEETIFSGALRSFVEEENGRLRARAAAEEQRTDRLRKRYQAVKEGHLHVIDDAIRLAEASGLHYQTGEDYLIRVHESGSVDDAGMQEVLKQYPYFPYGLIFDSETDEEKFLASIDRDSEWLPSVVPLFTMEEVAQVLNGSLTREELLGCYDRRFFDSREDYAERLQGEIQSSEGKAAAIRESGRHTEEVLERVKSFRYEKDWLGQAEARLAGLEKERKDLEKQAEDLQNEQTAQREKLAKIRRDQRDAANDRNRLMLCMEEMKEFRGRMAEERSREEEIQNLYREIEQKKRELREVTESLASLDQKIRGEQERQEELRQKEEEIEGILAQVAENETEGTSDGGTDGEFSQSSEKDKSSEKENGRLLEGTYDQLYREYDTIRTGMDRSVQDLKRVIEKLQREIAARRRMIGKTGLEPGEYENLDYSEEQEENLHARRESCEKEKDAAAEIYNRANAAAAGTREKLAAAGKTLSVYGGEPLPAGEIGTDFERRAAEVDARRKEAEKKLSATEKYASDLHGLAEQVRHAMKQYPAPDNPSELPAIEVDFAIESLWTFWDNLEKTLREQEKELNRQSQEAMADLDDLRHRFDGAVEPEIVDGLQNIGRILSGGQGGGRYGVAYHAAEEMHHSLELMNAQIRSELAGITNDYQQLTRQCLIQGREVYRNLNSIARNSRVKVWDDGPAQQMIRFDIPANEEGLEELAGENIAREISRGADEIVAMRQKPDVRDMEIEKKAAAIVGSERLLHLYVGREHIGVQVYKIDYSRENSRYKSWEKARTENSGAEKFVVYFTAILSLMNYIRSVNGMNGRNGSDVLLLDNPFGEITSAHLLKPTFEIARHFHVQLICMSDITKPDVVNCFDNVIRLIIKGQAGSSLSVMTHEGNEFIEHGYYKTYGQMSLFEDM